MLDGFRQAGVQDEADVRPIDAHSERHCGDNDAARFGREGLRYAIEEMTEPKLLVMNLR